MVDMHFSGNGFDAGEFVAMSDWNAISDWVADEDGDHTFSARVAKATETKVMPKLADVAANFCKTADAVSRLASDESHYSKYVRDEEVRPPPHAWALGHSSKKATPV
jgi:hypothetical protein